MPVAVAEEEEEAEEAEEAALVPVEDPAVETESPLPSHMIGAVAWYLANKSRVSASLATISIPHRKDVILDHFLSSGSKSIISLK